MPAFTLLTGYEQHELEATKLGHMLSATTREKHLRDTAAAAPPHETVIDAPFLPCKNDTTLDVEIRLSPIVDRLDEDVRNVVVILRDKTEQNRAKEAHARTEIVASMNAELQHEIVERRRVEQQLSHLASHDALTGLPNRTLFKKYVEQAIASCRDHTNAERSRLHRSRSFQDGERLARAPHGRCSARRRRRADCRARYARRTRCVAVRRR